MLFYLNDILNSINIESDYILHRPNTITYATCADDAVVCAESAETLQNILNQIEKYCNTWG